MVISEHLYGEMLKQNQFGNQTFAMLVAKIDEIPWMIADDRDDFKDAFSKLFFYSHDVYKLQHENVYVNPGSDFYKPLEELILKMHEHGLIHYLKNLCHEFTLACGVCRFHCTRCSDRKEVCANKSTDQNDDDMMRRERWMSLRNLRVASTALTRSRVNSELSNNIKIKPRSIILKMILK